MACSVETGRDELLEEVELLQAIYIHELELQGPVERPTSLTLFLHPSTGNDDHTLKYVCLNLCLTIPAEYPSVIPGISIQNPRGLSDAHINSIQENLLELAKEKTGSPILYDLIEYAKDCLSDNNVPSCPCVICLEHFHEEKSFVKTKCYHYFHSFCLGKYVDHFLQENEKVLCPMCRLEIDFDKTKFDAEYDHCVSEEIFVYKPDKEQQKAQRQRQRILEYQTQKGGIINIEEERNKYLIEIKGTKPERGGGIVQMNSLCDKKVAEKREETLGKVGNEQRQLVKEVCKGREGVSRDKRGAEGQDGKSRIISRTYQKDQYGMDDNQKRIEKDRRDNYHKEFRSNQRNSKNEGAGRKDGGYQRRPGRTASDKHRNKQEQLETPGDKQKQVGTSGDKQEQLGTHGDKQEQLRSPGNKQEQLETPGKKERTEEFPSLEKHGEKFIEEKDLNRNTKLAHGQVEQIRDSEEYKGTDGNGLKNHSLPSQDNGLNSKEVFSPETGVSNKCFSKEEIKSKRRELQCQVGTNSDPKIVPKNSRKRRSRRPRSRDAKTALKTVSSKVPSDAESKGESKECKRPSRKHEISQEAIPKSSSKTSVALAVENKIAKPTNMNEQKLSKNVSSLKNAPRCDVTATKLSLHQPPPGFESVTPQNKALLPRDSK